MSLNMSRFLLFLIAGLTSDLAALVPVQVASIDQAMVTYIYTYLQLTSLTQIQSFFSNSFISCFNNLAQSPFLFHAAIYLIVLALSYLYASEDYICLLYLVSYSSQLPHDIFCHHIFIFD